MNNFMWHCLKSVHSLDCSIELLLLNVVVIGFVHFFSVAACSLYFHSSLRQTKPWMVADDDAFQNDKTVKK